MLSGLCIQKKISIVYMLVTGIVLALAIFISAKINLSNAEKNIISSLNVVGEIVADSSAASVAFIDVESAQSYLSSLRSHHSIEYACIRTINNLKFAEYSVDSANVVTCNDYIDKEEIYLTDGFVNLFKPIMLEGKLIGSLQVRASINDLTVETIKNTKLSVIIFFALLVVASLVSRRMMKFITEPISRLKDIAQTVTKHKDYSLRVKKTSKDEVGVLIAAFNNMLDQIQSRDKALSEEKEKAEISAVSAKQYALEKEKINKILENEIKERSRIEKELHELNETLEDKVNERTIELKELNEKIGDIARSSGMAEVASGVLHNVGNVLNSVNVSASVLREKIRKTKSDKLTNVVDMLDENKANIAEFIGQNEKGKQIPKFLSLLAGQLVVEKESMYKELDELSSNIDHIKNVISMQQSYAGSYGVNERVDLIDLVEDALRINMQGMERHGIKVSKSYADTSQIYVDKHKVLQVIINLISNAKYALIDSKNSLKKLGILFTKTESEISIEVKDTGVGISEEDIKHLFEYGFKKRRDGHGFGLHHSAVVAKELGGKIIVHSDGLGMGASFILTLPYQKPENMGAAL